MTQDPELDLLERRVGRALKRLPTPAAPASLAARVMTSVQTINATDATDATGVTGVTGAARASLEWPLALKVAFTAMGFALVVGALLMWPLALEFARTSWQSPLVVLTRTTASALRPMIPVALLYVTAMCVVAAAAASMLKHVALGGATNS